MLAGAGLGEEGVEGVVAAAEWSCRTACDLRGREDGEVELGLAAGKQVGEWLTGRVVDGRVGEWRVGKWWVGEWMSCRVREQVNRASGRVDEQVEWASG